LEKNYDAIVHFLEQRHRINFKEKAYVALDEIQLVPNLPSVVKYLYDTYDIKWFLTGSSSYYMKNLFHESLAGRKKIFELYPLDFGEFLDFKGVFHREVLDLFEPSLLQTFLSHEYERLRPYYEEYIRYGGFPEVVLAAGREEKENILKDIVSSYVNMDIEVLSDFRKKNKLIDLMKLLTTRAGSRIDVAELSRVLGISGITVESYLQFFQDTYLISRIPVHTKNRDREIVKANKLYFHDTGILNILGEASSGAQFENAIYAQLRRFGEVRYYAQKSGREIDFVLDGKLGFEAKERPTNQDNLKLIRLKNTAELSQTRLIGRHETPGFQDYIWGGNIH
jgi:predicted AAA+ superfamily ATPase